MASGNERHLRAHRADHPRRQTPRARIRGENQRYRPEPHDAPHLEVRRYRHSIRFLQQRGLDVVETAVSGRFAVRRMAENTDDVAALRRALRSRHRRLEPQRTTGAGRRTNQIRRPWIPRQQRTTPGHRLHERTIPGRTEKPTRQGGAGVAERRPSKRTNVQRHQPAARRARARTNRSRHAMEQNRRERTTGTGNANPQADRTHRKRPGTRPTAN